MLAGWALCGSSLGSVLLGSFKLCVRAGVARSVCRVRDVSGAGTMAGLALNVTLPLAVTSGAVFFLTSGKFVA